MFFSYLIIFNYESLSLNGTHKAEIIKELWANSEEWWKKLRTCTQKRNAEMPMEEVWGAGLVDMQPPVSATSVLLRSVVVNLLSVDFWTRRTVSAVHVHRNSMHLPFAPVLITDPLEIDKTRRNTGRVWIGFFRDTASCNLLKVSPRFGRTCHLHFQGRDVGWRP
jgi:hypothetical protein